MKRIILYLAIAATVALFSGCSILADAIHKDASTSASQTTSPSGSASGIASDVTPQPASSPSPLATAEPPKAPPTVKPNIYSSTAMGISFTLPDSWKGKYRIKEGDGYITVSFKPSEPIDEGMGVFFSIVVKTSDDDEYFLDNPQDFTIGGADFIFGTTTDVTYFENSPEYDTYTKMQKDLPAIFQSLKAAG